MKNPKSSKNNSKKNGFENKEGRKNGSRNNQMKSEVPFDFDGEQLNKIAIVIVFLIWANIHLPIFVSPDKLPFLQASISLAAFAFVTLNGRRS
jgi:hypothetical protein